MEFWQRRLDRRACNEFEVSTGEVIVMWFTLPVDGIVIIAYRSPCSKMSPHILQSQSFCVITDGCWTLYFILAKLWESSSLEKKEGGTG